MKNFICSKTLRIALNYPQNFKTWKNALEKCFIIRKVNTRFFVISTRRYPQIRDYNFNYFHQNPIYDTFFQVSVKPTEHLSLVQYTMEDILNALSTNDMTELTQDKIVEMMEWIAHAQINPDKIQPILKILDHRCSVFICYMALNTSFYIFDMWFIILGYNAFSTQYFLKALKLWFQNFEHMSKNNIVQILYYLGQHKKLSNKTIRKNMKIIEEKQKEMTDIEFAIVCLSLFKLRIKSVPEQMLSRAVNTGQNLILRDERFHLISVLKFLRQLQHYDNQLYNLVGQYILKNWNSFNFIECVHFLATFSSQSVYDNDLYKLLESRGMDLLEKEKKHFPETGIHLHSHPSSRSRVKDITRYLWAMVNVGHELMNNTIEIILSIVRTRHSMGEYKMYPHILVDCLQSFAIINIYPADLIACIFDVEFLSQLQILKKDKPLHQVYFLFRSFEIECPSTIELCKMKPKTLDDLKPVPKNLNEQINKRIDMKNLLTLIENLKIPDLKVEVICALTHIVILGIKLTYVKNSKVKIKVPIDSKVIYVEIIDSTVCCRNSQKPVGLMTAKLRQLSKSKHAIIVLTEKDIGSINAMPFHDQNKKLRELFHL